MKFFDTSKITEEEGEIIIKPIQIRKMLTSYLTVYISDYDFCDHMYLIIQCVSNPEIDGDIDEEIIKEYLQELDEKYSTDDTSVLLAINQAKESSKSEQDTKRIFSIM